MVVVEVAGMMKLLFVGVLIKFAYLNQVVALCRCKTRVGSVLCCVVLLPGCLLVVDALTRTGNCYCN